MTQQEIIVEIHFIEIMLDNWIFALKMSPLEKVQHPHMNNHVVVISSNLT